MTELQPCPICKGTRICIDGGDNTYHPRCLDCGCTAPFDAWQSRIPAPAEAERLVDDLLSVSKQLGQSEARGLYDHIEPAEVAINDLKSRLLAALSNKGENLSGDVIVPGTEMIPKEWPDDSISIPDNPDEWTDADYENAMALVRPIFDQIGTYEAKHFPMDEPSREAQEEFRRDQMGEVLIIDHHQSLLELGNILFHDARPTNEIESTGIKKYWMSKSRIIPYKKIK